MVLTKQGSKALGLVCGISNSKEGIPNGEEEDIIDKQTYSNDNSDADERHEFKWE